MRYRPLLILLALTAWLHPLQAEPIELTMRVPILDGELMNARREALRAGLTVALERQGVVLPDPQGITAQQLQRQAIVLESGEIRFHSQITDEQLDGSHLVLGLKVELEHAQGCSGPTSPLTKSIAVTAFPMLQAALRGIDRADLERDMPRDLINALRGSGIHKVRDLTHLTIYQDPSRAPMLTAVGTTNLPDIEHLAHRSGAQLLLSGVIRNYQLEGYITPAQIDLELYIHDGISGALVAQLPFHLTLQRSVSTALEARYSQPLLANGLPRPTLSEGMARIGQAVESTLACLPLTARVIQVTDEGILIDAGTAAKLRTGDIFTLYRREPGEGPLRTTPLTRVTVTSAHPQVAVTTPDEQVLVRAGDLVREW